MTEIYNSVIIKKQHWIQRPSGAGGGGVGGVRNMKSMWPPLTSIFFITYYYGRGDMAPSPPGSASEKHTIILTSSPISSKRYYFILFKKFTISI